MRREVYTIIDGQNSKQDPLAIARKAAEQKAAEQKAEADRLAALAKARSVLHPQPVPAPVRGTSGSTHVHTHTTVTHGPGGVRVEETVTTVVSGGHFRPGHPVPPSVSGQKAPPAVIFAHGAGHGAGHLPPHLQPNLPVFPHARRRF